jgi:hypothetical protein
MKNVIKSAFQNKIIILNVIDIVPTKDIPARVFHEQKYLKIRASVTKKGVIEPLVVSQKNGKYELLDGHLRLHVLKLLNIPTVSCLVALDNESYTYNRHVSYLSPQQEHNMIVKAINEGIPIEELAETLHFDKSTILRKKNLMNGICDGVKSLVADKHVTSATFDYLRKMKEVRQISAVNTMLAMNDLSGKMARMLWIESKPEELHNPIRHATPEEIERMSRLKTNLDKVQKEMMLINDDFGHTTYDFMVMQRQLRKIMQNDKVAKYLQQNYKEMGECFEDIVNFENSVALF